MARPLARINRAASRRDEAAEGRVRRLTDSPQSSTLHSPLTATLMPELTDERFEQILTEKLAALATKEQIEELAQMTARGFEDVLQRLDVRERVEKLESQMKELRCALHLSS